MTAPVRLPVGIHDDVPAAVYHADPGASPTLSSSIAKVMLADTPRHAWFAHPRLNPAFEAKSDDKFSLGSVAHELLLGRGGGCYVCCYPDWRTKKAQEERAQALSDGALPILLHQYEQAIDVAQAVCRRMRQIEECLRLFDPFGNPDVARFVNGVAERVLIWQDIGGPLCRAMIDWQGPSETEIWDVKTTGAGLSDDEIARTIVNMGYDLSAAFYLRGLTQLLPQHAGRFKFRWIFVQDEAPFECRVVEPDAAMLTIGDRKAALAIEKWRRCLETDLWPGYPPAVTRVSLPGWAETKWMAVEMSDDDALNFRPSFTPLPDRVSGRLSEIAS